MNSRSRMTFVLAFHSHLSPMLFYNVDFCPTPNQDVSRDD